MIWKTIFLAFLAVGVLGEFEVTDDLRQQFREVLRKSCKDNGNEDKFEAVESTIKNFVECAKGLFDAETIKKEVEEAKPNGALDEVFKKYCAKSPQLKNCIHTVTAGVSPCLSQKMRDQISFVDNSTDQLIDFLCYKDGDRIALFIAESGPECFKEKINSIRQCGDKLKDVASVDKAQSLSKNEQCRKYDEVTSCIVTALEECDTPTPGNMAEALFRYIRNGSPCKDIKA